MVRPASVCCPQDESKTMRSAQCGFKRFCNLCRQRPTTTTMITTPLPSTTVHVESEMEVASVTTIAPYIFNHHCCCGCDQQQEMDNICGLWFDLGATEMQAETESFPLPSPTLQKNSTLIAARRSAGQPLQRQAEQREIPPPSSSSWRPQQPTPRPPQCHKGSNTSTQELLPPRPR